MFLSVSSVEKMPGMAAPKAAPFWRAGAFFVPCVPLLLAALLSAMSASAHSQVGGIEFSPELSIDDALRIVVSDHPSVQQRLSEVRAAQRDLEVARWQRFPSLSASASEAVSQLNQSNAVLQQPVWTGGRITAAIEVAEAARDASNFAVLETQQALMVEVVTRFFALRQARGSYAVAESNIAAHQALRDMIARRVEATASPEIDQMLAAARLASAESDALSYEAAAGRAESALAIALGLEAIGPLEVAALAPEALSQTPSVDEALASSGSLQLFEAQALQAQAEALRAKAETRPQLAVAYDRRFGDLLPGQQREQVFIQLEYQPGAGLSARAAMASARERALAAKQAAEAQALAVSAEVLSLQAELRARQAQEKAASAMVAANAQVVESYLRQYRVGNKSWLDVMNAQRESAQAELNLVSIENDLLSIFYRLRIASGEIWESRK